MAVVSSDYELFCAIGLDVDTVSIARQWLALGLAFCAQTCRS